MFQKNIMILIYTSFFLLYNLHISSDNNTNLCHNFYKKNIETRHAIIQNIANLSSQEMATLANPADQALKYAENMIENAVSAIPLPLGIAVYFIINNKEYLIPMATEEPSIIAAASRAAKLTHAHGGFTSCASEPVMIGQIILTHIPDIQKACNAITMHKDLLLKTANEQITSLVMRGGGAKDLIMRIIQTPRGTMLIVHLLINVQDAMGANIINTTLEKIAPKIQELTGGTTLMSILSNLSTYRLITATATWPKKLIGTETIERILDAHACAQADIYRCATHNKGIMNGIDAVALATGNDFRAIEAGAHAYASITDSYQPLTNYTTDSEGNLVGTITIPLAIGIIGGSTQKHPLTTLCIHILKVESANELATVMASVGLAQNFAALYALVTEGIQKGHMKLHKKNIGN